MKILYGSSLKEIKTYNENIESEYDWTTHYKNSDSNHSSWLLGKFIMNDNGLSFIQHKIENILSSDVTFEKCIVEKSVKFDEFPRPSMRDMVIEGKTKKNEKLFITIEAKALENFGPTISSALRMASSEKYKSEHPDSKRIDRIKGLYNKIIGETLDSYAINDSTLRYQLFHAAAATASVKADYNIMIVLEFNNGNRLRINRIHFEEFMTAIKATMMVRENDFLLYEGAIMDCKVRFLYLEVCV